MFPRSSKGSDTGLSTLRTGGAVPAGTAPPVRFRTRSRTRARPGRRPSGRTVIPLGHAVSDC
ncbi:hypothetical protein CURTO8I2_290100 [Curtobacterium sp. 8I-2]|nr:hypothetical protein CURTO8I2_290100 [Curtobacterium sp. 8I-2]